MRDLKISLCKHPTTVVLIDDDKNFLREMQCDLSDLSHKTFSNPLLAIEYLNQPQHQHSFIARCIQEPEEESPDRFVSQVSLRAIQEETHRAERYDEIAVVVVDYDMPAINGIALCERINNPNLRFILLTGNADVEIAIAAFNKGIIHKFIKKTTANIEAELLQAIRQLEQQYFINLSHTLLGNASSTILKLLEDNAVAQLFTSICDENHIVEHYVMNDAGDFLLVNAQGHISRLSIMSDAEILKLYEFAVISQASPHILTTLTTKTHLPVFWDSHDIDNTPPHEWESYFYPAYPVPNSAGYYYAYRKQPAVTQASTVTRFYSFDQHLKVGPKRVVSTI